MHDFRDCLAHHSRSLFLTLLHLLPIPRRKKATHSHSKELQITRQSQGQWQGQACGLPGRWAAEGPRRAGLSGKQRIGG